MANISKVDLVKENIRLKFENQELRMRLRSIEDKRLVKRLKKTFSFLF